MLAASDLPADPNTGVGLKKLTPREHLFVLEYIKTDNMIEAATKAGYHDSKYGYKLIKQPHIEAELARVRANLYAVQIVSKDYVLSELVGLFNEARTDEVRQDRRTMMQCLDMIAKLAGFYTPDTQVNIQNNVNSIKIEIVKPEDTNYEDSSEQPDND